MMNSKVFKYFQIMMRSFIRELFLLKVVGPKLTSYYSQFGVFCTSMINVHLLYLKRLYKLYPEQ